MSDKSGMWIDKKPHVSMIGLLNKSFVDLSGDVFGGFVVTGYLGKGRWQVECDCGNFASRSSKVIKKAPGFDKCCECIENEKYVTV